MIELLTAVLAVATLAYTWLTYKILQANQRNIEVMKEQALALTRPYIDVYVVAEPETPLFSLHISNNGKTAARNLRLTMDRPFFQHGQNEVGRDVSGFSAFSETIPSFAPGTSLSFYLATSLVVFGDTANSDLTPISFVVTANYEVAGQEVSESTTVDLEPFRNTAIPIDRGVEKISKALIKIEEAISR